MKVRCTKDNEGYWTEGEVYRATPTAGGVVLIPDDDDPDAEWSLMPTSYEDDENNTATYQATGLDAEFKEVKE